MNLPHLHNVLELILFLLVAVVFAACQGAFMRASLRPFLSKQMARIVLSAFLAFIAWVLPFCGNLESPAILLAMSLLLTAALWLARGFDQATPSPRP